MCVVPNIGFWAMCVVIGCLSHSVMCVILACECLCV